MSKPTISIVGTGYVGLSTAVVLANSGYKVFTIDIDQKKIDIIKSGKSFFYEIGMDELIQKALKEKTLIPTTDFSEAIPTSDVIFSCVGTPDRPDGSPNLDYIYDSAASVVKYATKPFVFVQKSTVPVGTAANLIKKMQELNSNDLEFSYISNPEFLREGSALYDTLNMDRIVLGGVDEFAVKQIAEIYKSVDEYAKKFNLDAVSQFAKDNNPAARPFGEKSFEDRVVTTSLESAELIKVSANAFLALKISFANEIALLCDKSGADVTEVMNGVGMDHRIGKAFLYAGRGYGGGCFPKDVKGLISVGDQHGIDMTITKAAFELNHNMPGYIIKKAINKFGGFKGKSVAVLGLAFKTGTSDTRKSPGIKLAHEALLAGACVTVYDPEAMEEAEPLMDNQIIRAHSLEAAIKDADIIVLATPWGELIKYPLSGYKNLMRGNFIIDAVNALKPKDVADAGFEYVGVGR